MVRDAFRQHGASRIFVAAGLIAALGAVSSACGGGGGDATKTATLAVASPAGTGTPASAASPERTVSAVAGSVTPAPAQTQAAETPPAVDLTSALVQQSDLPATLTLRPSSAEVVHAGDVPGLTTDASGARQQAIAASRTQFLSVLAVAPDSGGPQSLLDAVTSDKYLPTLTSRAPDAQWSELPTTGAPPGARSYAYTATVSLPAGQAALHGVLVAFTQGNVFVLLNYGSYEAGDTPPDLNALASTLAGRLAATSR